MTGVLRAARTMARSCLLAYLAAACSAWHPKTESVGIVFARGEDRARVVLTDGRTVELRDAGLEGDSLVGMQARSGARVAVARADVRVIEVREKDFVRSAALGLGIYAALTVAYLVVLATALSGANF